MLQSLLTDARKLPAALKESAAALLQRNGLEVYSGPGWRFVCRDLGTWQGSGHGTQRTLLGRAEGPLACLTLERPCVEGPRNTAMAHGSCPCSQHQAHT